MGLNMYYHVSLVYYYFFKFRGVGWDWVHLVRRPLIGLLYQPRMTDEYGAFGGMRTSRGSRSTHRKLAIVHFVHHKSHRNRPGIEPGPPATNRVSYGTALSPVGFTVRTLGKYEKVEWGLLYIRFEPWQHESRPFGYSVRIHLLIKHILVAQAYIFEACLATANNWWAYLHIRATCFTVIVSGPQSLLKALSDPPVI
jgi:hypothetical protein